MWEEWGIGKTFTVQCVCVSRTKVIWIEPWRNADSWVWHQPPRGEARASSCDVKPGLQPIRSEAQVCSETMNKVSKGVSGLWLEEPAGFHLFRRPKKTNQMRHSSLWRWNLWTWRLLKMPTFSSVLTHKGLLWNKEANPIKVKPFPAWWYMLLIPTLGRLRQEDQKSEISLGGLWNQTLSQNFQRQA